MIDMRGQFGERVAKTKTRTRAAAPVLRSWEKAARDLRSPTVDVVVSLSDLNRMNLHGGESTIEMVLYKSKFIKVPL